jgi:thiosulfate dehydrogenase [quinone] large subunit
MKKPKLFITLLRVSLGWVFLYQGIVAITDASWSLVPYIQNAKTFTGFYAGISAEPMLGYVSLVVKGVFILVGVLLILGLGHRLAPLAGIALMLFFYFPLLDFPRVGSVYYIVDEHIMYCFILAYLFVARTAEHFGISKLFHSSRYS